MNIGNITSNNMNLTENGRFMQIEIYEKEIERLNNIIKEVREYINWRLEEHQDMYKYQMEELLEILDKGSDKE